MAYFFPQPMTYCQALVPTEIAWDVLNQLGQQETIALESNVVNYDNPFIRSYRRCEQLLAKIQAIRTILTQCTLWIDFSLKEVQDTRPLWRSFNDLIFKSNIEGYLYINQIEEEVLTTHGYLSSQMHQIDNFSKRVTDLVLSISLLLTIQKHGGIQMLQGQSNPLYQSFDANQKSSMFQSKCISVKRKELMVLKRSIFRITRGNCWVNEIEISLQELNRYFTSAKHRKLASEALQDQVACLIVFPKGERGVILSKIDRLMACMNCHIMGQERNNISQELQKKEQKINDIEAMEDLTFEGIRKHISRLAELREGGVGSWLCEMQLYVKKERQIYRALSTTQVTKSLARFRLYIPSKQMPLIIQPKKNLPPLTLNILQSNKMPPSKFDTNCMLKIPQEIVNTYGVPSYTEINPAPFYIITFGFFIGVMFGDIGHMLLAIPLLIHLKANLWFWTVVCFMGYCGLIYNEFFGLNLGFFSSCYTIVEGSKASFVQKFDNCIYPIGVDSIWKVSFNQMSFTNSLKMKMAVIFGVVHMMLGLFLRLYNNVRKNKWLDLLTLTIPQIIFMCCTFVYMDFIIIYKWSSNYDSDTSKAPSIISTMISVFVNMAKYDPKDLLFWPSQRTSEKIIVALALLCIPVMLMVKPLVIYCRRKNKHLGEPIHMELEMKELHEENESMDLDDREGRLSNEELKTTYSSQKKVEEAHEQQSLKEIAVHQFIETIEFVLGSVSNTASYLRLWALSLAHAQLSTVIFELTVLKQLQKASIVGVFLIFPFYLAVTFGVLICMDSLQCFLHSLRLHWVEFQNKFYEGKGYLFNAFSFRKLK